MMEVEWVAPLPAGRGSGLVQGWFRAGSGYHGAMGSSECAPVRHHPPLEPHLVLQVPEGLRVLTRPNAVDSVVAAHDASNSSLHRADKGRVVDLRRVVWNSEP